MSKNNFYNKEYMIKSLNTFLSKAFSCITVQRTALMGVAMFAVYMFHAVSLKLAFTPKGIVGFLCQYGSWGVDVFLFLSSIGLCYSLQKNQLKVFYKNRVVRILPTWLTVLVIVHVTGLFISSKLPDMNFGYPRNFVEGLCWYTGVGFFLNKCHYEWYVPALLLLYSISPLIYKTTKTVNVMLIIFSIFINVFNNIYDIFPHLSIFIERLPVFCLGFLFYKESATKTLFHFLVLEVFFILIAYAFWMLNICSATIMFGFIVPVILLILSQLFNYMRIIPYCFALLGGVSLEFYLIHLYRRPQFLMSLFVDNANLQVLLAFILCFVLSYLLQIIVKRLFSLFNMSQKLKYGE